MKHRPTSSSRHGRQRGVALLEALIAILLFSIGILGMVALQAKSTQFSVESQDRTTAALLANDAVATLLATNSLTLSSADSSAWSSRIAAALPGGSGVLSSDSCGNREVSVVWTAVSKNSSSGSSASGSASSAASSAASSSASSAASSAGMTSGYGGCTSGFTPPPGANSVFTTKFILMPTSSSSSSGL